MKPNRACFISMRLLPGQNFAVFDLITIMSTTKFHKAECSAIAKERKLGRTRMTNTTVHDSTLRLSTKLTVQDEATMITVLEHGVYQSP